MASQKYLPLHEDDLGVDRRLGTSRSHRRFSKLGYLTITMLFSCLLAGLIGTLVVVHVGRPGPESLCDSSHFASRRYHGRGRPPAVVSAGSKTLTLVDSMSEKRAPIDESPPGALLNATVVAQFRAPSSANITALVVAGSLAARTVEDDMLETLGNTTAVAAYLLKVPVPALIAREDITSFNSAGAAGAEATTGVLDLALPPVTKDLLTSASALGDDVLQTLLNATTLAEQLLGAVIPALVARTNTSTLKEAFVAYGKKKVGVPDIATSIGKRDLITSASGLVTSASALGSDVLQTLLNATAVAEQLLGTVIPALVARAENRTLNFTTVAGSEVTAGIPDILVPNVTKDFITSAGPLSDDVLQTLVNATAVAEQLLGTVIPP
ncbi:hypothetical protein V1524DRAFT_465591 [Lipomyces starkeyi]